MSTPPCCAHAIAAMHRAGSHHITFPFSIELATNSTESCRAYHAHVWFAMAANYSNKSCERYHTEVCTCCCNELEFPSKALTAARTMVVSGFSKEDQISSDLGHDPAVQYLKRLTKCRKGSMGWTSCACVSGTCQAMPSSTDRPFCSAASPLLKPMRFSTEPASIVLAKSGSRFNTRWEA